MGKKEEIRAALQNSSPEIVMDALALLLADGSGPSQESAKGSIPELSNFAQAIHFFKKNYDFPELDYFTTEADLVYITTSDRKILITDKTTAYSSASPSSNNNIEETVNKESKAEGDNNIGRFSHLEL